MNLFLASTIKHPNTLKRLEEYMGGFKNKSVAYIPTASNGEEGWGKWEKKQGGSWEVAQKLGFDIESILLEDYRNDSVLRKLKNRDAIWFGGGVPGYLMYWIKRCHLDKKLIDILNKGTLFIGSSAGTMIAGNSLDVASWGFVDGERGSDIFRTLQYVDFDIFPHFEDSLFEKIKRKYTGKKMYLLKDGEEIIVEDKKITVIGDERIITNE